MNISIYCVGKVKEKFYRDAIDEYVKRLKRYASVKIIEVADEKTPDKAGDELNRQIMKKEGQRLTDRIPERTYLIALAIDGRKRSSTELADHIKSLTVSGHSDIGFVIGGSLGLSEDVLKRADESLSFSDMTFPHQLMRVILLEQIYRSCRIINNEPYHK